MDFSTTNFHNKLALFVSGLNQDPHVTLKLIVDQSYGETAKFGRPA
jgi:hypothetical protein